MKRKTKKTIQVTLELTEEETQWLHDLMQNPLFEDESEYDADMRAKFFQATKLP